MPTKDDVDETFQRIALAALAYYPEVQRDEPGYQLDEDITWCLEPLTDLDEGTRTRLRDVAGRTIVDPTEYRQALFGTVLSLLPD